jgi:hypothetical protein
MSVWSLGERCVRPVCARRSDNSWSTNRMLGSSCRPPKKKKKPVLEHEPRRPWPRGATGRRAGGPYSQQQERRKAYALC